MIDVRVIGADEWRVWRALRLAALAEAPAAYGSTLAQWMGSGDNEDRWRSRLADVALNVVLFLDGEPAGMVSALGPDPEGKVELISMWVAPFARGRGVGDAAVRHIVAWAQTEHGAPVVLSVKADNDHAIRLYRRHAFVDAGSSPDDPSERLMRRSSMATSSGLC